MALWPNASTTIPHVASEYGPRRAPTAGASTFHRGIDLTGFPRNCAAEAGVVTFSGYAGGAGNQVKLRGDSGTVFVYDHAKTGGLLVAKGQRVTAGQALSVVGMTGVATGPHCHFETHPHGGADINPRIYMAAHSTTAGGNATPFEEDEEDEMKILTNLTATDGDGTSRLGNVYFSGPGGIKWVKDPADLALLRRYIDIVQNGASDVMYTSQIAVVNYYLQPDPPTVNVAGLGAAVTKAVTDAVKASGVTVDVAAIASAVDGALADNFASIPAAVNVDAAARLAK